MKDFFKDKKNLIFVVLLGVALVGLLISSFWEGFMPISCILFGLVCVYTAYLFVLKYVKVKNRNIDEFISEEDKLKRKTSRFLESESKMNIILLAVLFFMMGILLIYYAIKVFGV